VRSNARNAPGVATRSRRWQACLTGRRAPFEIETEELT
jgi:hypothetical protein